MMANCSGSSIIGENVVVISGMVCVVTFSVGTGVEERVVTAADDVVIPS